MSHSKRLHQSPTWWISLEALRTTFLDGLTLLHAARLDPTALPSSVLQRAIRANSNTLFTYIQHFPAAQSFHDAFEDLASRVLDFIATPPNETPSGGSAIPLPLPMANSDDFPWASLLTEMPSVMSSSVQPCTKLPLTRVLVCRCRLPGRLHLAVGVTRYTS